MFLIKNNNKEFQGRKELKYLTRCGDSYTWTDDPRYAIFFKYPNIALKIIKSIGINASPMKTFAHLSP